MMIQHPPKSPKLQKKRDTMAKRLFGGIVLVLLLTMHPGRAEAVYTIAYASFAPVHSEIFLADADGKHPQGFLSSPAQQWDASFSRDGAWIVFTSMRNGSADIYRAHPDGSKLERLTDDPAFDDQAALSPDGRRLAFVSTRSGHAEIWTLDLRTRQLRNLTNHPGGHFRPAWSPNGEWIAFSSDRDSPHLRRPNGFETIQRTEIYLMHSADGSSVHQLTHTDSYAGSPCFSPDGKQIVFYAASFEDVIAISDPRRLRATTQIAIVDVVSGADRSVTNGKGEKWSPRWITPDVIGYSSGGPDQGLEFTTSSKGARGEFNNPAWSPDGRRMVFHRDTGQSWPPVIETPSTDPQFRLLRAGIFPSFSPSGDRLASTTGFSAFLHNGLMTSSIDGSNRWLIHDDLEHNTVAPSWSPLGDLIAFGSGGAFQGVLNQGRQISNIAVVAPDGSGFRLLTEGEGNNGFPSWSPDGRYIVFRLQDERGKGLRILDIETRRITVLTDGNGNHDNFPAWSPKGDEISFSSDREDGDWEIYAIRPDGAGLRRITHIPGNDAHSSWSPDGKWLVFATGRDGFKDEMALHPHNPQSYGEIAVMRPDGSDLRILTDNPWEDSTPRWAPMP
jgi:Tol biopolymer transport system component